MQKSQDRTELLKSAPVKGALLKLGMPTLVGMSVSALYNVIDAFFVGQLGGSQMAAVSLFAPIATAMLGLALLFGGGAASYISRLLGAGKRGEANECASTSLATSMAVAILLLAGFVAFAEPVPSCAGRDGHHDAVCGGLRRALLHRHGVLRLQRHRQQPHRLRGRDDREHGRHGCSAAYPTSCSTPS